MNIKALIRERRTIHAYQHEDCISLSEVKEIIATACWAPNHHLSQPWHFYLLGKETINDICQLNRAFLSNNRSVDEVERKMKRWLTIPGWIIVTCDQSEDALRYQEDYAACACAMQNIMLQLWDKGMGSKWSTGALTREQAFYECISVDSQLEKVIGILWYGKPDVIPRSKRKDASQFIIELP
ncbi:MAG: nitroreductase [Pseudomonadota bacterium]